MYGQITALDDGSITITGVQHHGNCPKYITRREISERERLALAIETKARNSLNADDTALVKAADTFLRMDRARPMMALMSIIAVGSRASSWSLVRRR